VYCLAGMLETKLFFSVKFQNFVVTCEYSNTDSLDLPLIMRLSVVRILLTVVKFDPCKKFARVLRISPTTGLGCVWMCTWSNLVKIWLLNIRVVCEDNVWIEAMIWLSQAECSVFWPPCEADLWARSSLSRSTKFDFVPFKKKIDFVDTVTPPD